MDVDDAPPAAERTPPRTPPVSYEESSITAALMARSDPDAPAELEYRDELVSPAPSDAEGAEGAAAPSDAEGAEGAAAPVAPAADLEFEEEEDGGHGDTVEEIAAAAAAAAPAPAPADDDDSDDEDAAILQRAREARTGRHLLEADDANDADDDVAACLRALRRRFDPAEADDVDRDLYEALTARLEKLGALLVDKGADAALAHEFRERLVTDRQIANGKRKFDALRSREERAEKAAAEAGEKAERIQQALAVFNATSAPKPHRPMTPWYGPGPGGHRANEIVTVEIDDSAVPEFRTRLPKPGGGHIAFEPTRDCALVVESGCGSGKTRQLMNWLAQCLEREPGVPILSISARRTHARDLAATLRRHDIDAVSYLDADGDGGVEGLQGDAARDVRERRRATHLAEHQHVVCSPQSIGLLTAHRFQQGIVVLDEFRSICEIFGSKTLPHTNLWTTRTLWRRRRKRYHPPVALANASVRPPLPTRRLHRRNSRRRKMQHARWNAT